jgi:hypothetical protein
MGRLLESGRTRGGKLRGIRRIFFTGRNLSIELVDSSTQLRYWPEHTLDGGRENGSNWNVFMRRSCSGRPCRDFVNCFSWSAETASGEAAMGSSAGVIGVGPAAISSMAEEKRTAGMSVFWLVLFGSREFFGASMRSGQPVRGD